MCATCNSVFRCGISIYGFMFWSDFNSKKYTVVEMTFVAWEIAALLAKGKSQKITLKRNRFNRMNRNKRNVDSNDFDSNKVR